MLRWILLVACATGCVPNGSATAPMGEPQPPAPEDEIAAPVHDAGTIGDGPAEGSPPSSADAGPQGLVWPNSASSANSDPWIIAHHDQLTQMRPGILALNFVNKLTTAGDTNAAMRALHLQTVAGIREGSRHLGYRQAEAAAFLDPRVVKSVDLTDKGAPPAGWNHLNSSRMPLKCNASEPYQFDYAALFTQKLADVYAIPDPAQPGHNLTLCELFAKGIIHDVWVTANADPDPYTCPNGVKMDDFHLPEVLENKQKYDASGKRLTGQFEPCAGNGCFSSSDIPAVTACGVSVRILFTNLTRGPGCGLHSLGHGIEWTGTSKAVPLFSADFLRFANFDLKRFGASTPAKLYDVACPTGTPNCISYPNSNSVRFPVAGTNTTFSPYDQGCGSVHFPPNARGHYDDQNPAPVLSSCAHFGMHDGTGGADVLEPYTNAQSMAYDALAPDCGGGWQVFWRQSFPGLGTAAVGAGGKPIHNWWPYLYY